MMQGQLKLQHNVILFKTLVNVFFIFHYKVWSMYYFSHMPKGNVDERGPKKGKARTLFLKFNVLEHNYKALILVQ